MTSTLPCYTRPSCCKLILCNNITEVGDPKATAKMAQETEAKEEGDEPTGVLHQKTRGILALL